MSLPVEPILQLSELRSLGTKLVHLEDDLVQEVEDFISTPPPTNRCEALKDRLLDRFAETQESKLQRLIQGVETAGLKPSEILLRMKCFAPDAGSEPIIRTLFICQMAQTIRPLLSVWKENDLRSLAKIADKMLEATNS